MHFSFSVKDKRTLLGKLFVASRFIFLVFLAFNVGKELMSGIGVRVLVFVCVTVLPRRRQNPPTRPWMSLCKAAPPSFSVY